MAWFNDDQNLGIDWNALLQTGAQTAQSLLSKKPGGPSVNLPPPSSPQIIMIPPAGQTPAARSSVLSNPLVIVGGLAFIGLAMFLITKKRR